MTIDEVRNYLNVLKTHIDQLDAWVIQATNMVYDIEEKLMDMDDRPNFYKKYYQSDSMDFLKIAASGVYSFTNSPPRLNNSSRCGNDSIAADGFYQSEFYIKKIV